MLEDKLKSEAFKPKELLLPKTFLGVAMVFALLSYIFTYKLLSPLIQNGIVRYLLYLGICFGLVGYYIHRAIRRGQEETEQPQINAKEEKR